VFYLGFKLLDRWDPPFMLLFLFLFNLAAKGLSHGTLRNPQSSQGTWEQFPGISQFGQGIGWVQRDIPKVPDAILTLIGMFQRSTEVPWDDRPTEGVFQGREQVPVLCVCVRLWEGGGGALFALEQVQYQCVVLLDSETEESERCGVVNSGEISSKIGSRSM
jgi:hypothetical protein